MKELETNRWIRGRQFAQSEKRLLDAIERVHTIPIATIKRRFEELKAKLLVCQSAHQNYIQSLHETLNLKRNGLKV